MVAAGAPNLPIGDIFPLIAMFAVANSALINMMMASRLLYGMAKQQVLPPVLGRVLEGRRTPWVAILFTTAIAVGLLIFVGSLENAGSQISLLGGTTALLLLAVFTVVNICCLVLRRDPVRAPALPRSDRAPDHRRARAAPTWSGRWTGRNPQQYTIAGLLLAVGVVLWVITFFINRAMWGRQTYVKDPEALEGIETEARSRRTARPVVGDGFRRSAPGCGRPGARRR